MQTKDLPRYLPQATAIMGLLRTVSNAEGREMLFSLYFRVPAVGRPCMMKFQCKVSRPRCRLPATAGTRVRHLSAGTHTWGMQKILARARSRRIAIVEGRAGACRRLLYSWSRQLFWCSSNTEEKYRYTCTPYHAPPVSTRHCCGLPSAPTGHYVACHMWAVLR